MRFSLGGAAWDRALAINERQVSDAAKALSMRMATGEPAR
jgi:hypothetical protein